jgi:hypothetical protein
MTARSKGTDCAGVKAAGRRIERTLRRLPATEGGGVVRHRSSTFIPQKLPKNGQSGRGLSPSH